MNVSGYFDVHATLFRVHLERVVKHTGVTERATAALKVLLDNQVHEPEEYIRILMDSEGNLRLKLARAIMGDQVVEHQGCTVMVVARAVCDALDGLTIDADGLPRGKIFNFNLY